MLRLPSQKALVNDTSRRIEGDDGPLPRPSKHGAKSPHWEWSEGGSAEGRTGRHEAGLAADVLAPRGNDMLGG